MVEVADERQVEVVELPLVGRTSRCEKARST
jgi:hypothetical protein